MYIDVYVTICSYDCACQLINYTLATEENVRNEEPAHVAIPFQLLEMSSITTPNQKILNIHTRYIYQRVFKGKISDFTDLHNGKNQSGSFV